MLRTLAALAAFVFAASHARAAEPPRTVAETSGYKATSTSADVLAFCEAIAARGPVAKLDSFGTSHGGQKLPLLVIADPPVATPEAARNSGKLVVLVFANIHAGEVDGKEAVLALARDLTEAGGGSPEKKKSHPLLKDLVILLVPNLNPDGNDKIDRKNRPGDDGPIDGAGTRTNAQGFDLNRDFVKLQSPEIRALVKLVNAWDPAMIIDCHTTNGSKHRYTLTYDGPRYPSTDTDLSKWSTGTLFPAVTKKVKDATGYDLGVYGNFSRDRTKWETYPALPRYSIQYFGLRGKLGVLSESYSYASFKDRALATRAFVTACLEVAVEKRRELAKLTTPAKDTRVAVKTRTDAFPDKWKVLGFEEVEKDGKRVATDRHKEYALDLITRVTPTEFAELPYAYLVPAARAEAIRTLQRHGVRVEELREDIDLAADALAVATATTRKYGESDRLMLTEVDGVWKAATRRVPAGTAVVKTDQPLGALAAYLLDPRAEDGLTTWGYFTDGLAAGTEFPVLRLPKAYPMAVGAARPLPETVTANKPITEAMLQGRGGGFTFGLAGAAITPGAWVDGAHFLQVKDGKLLKVEARTGTCEPFADAAKVKQSLAALKDVPAATADRLARGTAFRTNPARTAFLFDIGSDLGLAYFDGTPAVRLTTGGGPKEHVSFSPDGTKVAFVRGANLFAVDVETRAEKQLTTDGGKDVFNGKADWVYEEEVFDRSGKAYWWAPDGKRVAFLRLDDAPVKKFNLVDLATPAGRLDSYAYPKPGDPNPRARIGVASADGGPAKFLDLGEYKPEDTIVSRVGWAGESGVVYAYLLNRTQTWLDFVVWPDLEAGPKRLFRETTKAWVEDFGPPHYLKDGSFLFLSGRDGWKHLYQYAADGKPLARVTKGEWEVRDVLRVDEGEKRVYFTATYTSPTGLDLCRVEIGKGARGEQAGGSPSETAGEPELLSERGRMHRVSLAPSGPLFVDRYTDPMTPTRARVCEAGRGAVRTLDANPVYERDGYKFGRYERVKVPLADGFVLEGAVTYPPDFDPTKKYPVWVFTYAGPHMPSLHDEWGGGRILEQALATSGIIAFRVDPRSASGKGIGSAWACYKQLGVQELKDLEGAVAWLAKNPYVDAARVGISGHSYGGFMAAYALTHSKVFAAGIAGAPVTDWRLYDSVYTERYMLTPKENPEGYEKSSCVAGANNLSGRLLVVHGMMDDNVHMQNSVQFVTALQRANKDFEMMFYPPSRHGIGGPHYLKLQLDFIRRTMKP